MDGDRVVAGVRVRLFAALREAAGEGECRVPSGTVAELLDGLRARYGPVFAARLALATVLVDGDAVPPDAGRVVADGAELALLPPVSGGAVGAP
jgi:molybdopterin converting factor small subunit